jgi:hypothetical protein
MIWAVVTTAVTRGLKTGMDIIMASLDADRFSDFAITKLHLLARDLEAKGIMTTDQQEYVQNLLARGEYAQVNRYLKEVQKGYVQGAQR